MTDIVHRNKEALEYLNMEPSDFFWLLSKDFIVLMLDEKNFDTIVKDVRTGVHYRMRDDDEIHGYLKLNYNLNTYKRIWLTDMEKTN